MTYSLITIIKGVAMGITGFIAGYFAAYFFNKIPAGWLCDYGAEPSDELKDTGIQRIKTYPWKFLMAAFLMIASVKMTLYDIQFALPSLVILWSMMLMAVADKKYMIIPDQFTLILVLAGIGFIPLEGDWKRQLLGAAIAFGLIFIIGIMSKLIYKKDGIGGGDLKVYTALGLSLGVKGFLIIFVLSTLFSAIHFMYEIIKKKAKWGDERPLIPYVFVATSIYLLILYPYTRGAIFDW